jgi:RNA polymerase sigma-70 factor (ECF subfamily)
MMAGEKKPVAQQQLHDEAKLRRYLLGACTPEESNEIDRALLSEASLPILEVVEDELIEDYITGELDEPDRRRFEGRLLRSDSIAEKIQISARLLVRQDAAREITRRIEAEAAKASATPIEEKLLAMVRELLGNDAVGAEDNFFLAGGHSLLGMQLVKRMRDAFGVDLALRQLFEGPTVECLALLVETMLIDVTEVRQRATSLPPPPRKPYVLGSNFELSYLERLRAGDRRTQEHFGRYFGTLIKMKLESKLNSPEGIAEIQQETFARFFSVLHDGKITEPERLGSFVNSICDDVLLEAHKGARLGRSAAWKRTEFPEEAPELVSLLAAKEAAEKVGEIMNGFIRVDQQLLRKILLEEQDEDKVCRDLGVDRNYLRMLLRRVQGLVSGF